MKEVNERTSAIITVSFFNEDEVACTPLSATVRIDDVKSGIVIRATTDVGVIGLVTSINVRVSSRENRIINNVNSSELRILTTEFLYAASDGETKTGTGEYRFLVKNLLGVVTPPSESDSPSSSASPSEGG